MTSGDDGVVCLWDAANGKWIARFGKSQGKQPPQMPPLPGLFGSPSKVGIMAFSPDGKHLASADADQMILLWDAATAREVRALSCEAQLIHLLAFSPDGKHLAAAGEADTVKIWDAASGEELRTLPTKGGMIEDLAFSPDGHRLAAVGRGGLRVWDTETGREVFTLRGHANAVSGVAFSRDGRRLATASFDGTVKIWEAAEMPGPVPGHR